MRKTVVLIFCIAVLFQSCTTQRQAWIGPTATGDKSMIKRMAVLLNDTLFDRSTVGISIYDLTDDRSLFTYNAHQLLRPASTMKLITAIAALDVLGSDYNFTTTIGYTGKISDGVLDGDIVCKGGMDPTFAHDDMEMFVNAIKNAGINTVKGNLVGDISFKDTLIWGSGWCWDDENPSLTPLLYNTKDVFLDSLQQKMVEKDIVIEGIKTNIKAKGTKILLSEKKTPIKNVMLTMMKESDNLFAECVYYNTALATGDSISTEKVREIHKKVFQRADINPEHCRLADGSGLSLYNYLSADLEVKMLIYAYKHKDIYNALYPTLPIAGINGTLAKRMKESPAYENVHAKTGTVRGVSALAGYLTATNGHILAFSIINQGIKTSSEGRDFQDRLCQELGR